LGLNLDLIGKTTEDVVCTYDADDVILYALGIGAGVENELDFVYERDLRVFPTFAVIPPYVEGEKILALLGVNLSFLLHAGHEIVLYEAIPTSATVYSRFTFDSIYDKGDAGALINYTIETRDSAGRLLFVNKATLIDRSAGNFGGNRGPKVERISPQPGQEPDLRVEYRTSKDQAALYRLSGDKNPIHIDPGFARTGGFSRPILQGLCTFGFAGRAILHGLCGSDPSRLKSLSVRFSNVVFPGDALVTEAWRRSPGRYVFLTKTSEGRTVLDNGLVPCPP